MQKKEEKRMSERFEQLAEYYRSNLMTLPHLSQFRQYKFLLSNGIVFRLRDIIRTPEQLQRHLVKHRPLKVWYSVSRFLNPQFVGPKGRNRDYVYAYNLFLGSDLVFDIDPPPEGTLEDARQNALKLTDFLEERGISNTKTIYSAGKGLHLYGLDWNPNIVAENPLEREKLYGEAKNKLMTEAQEQGIVFDKKTSVDTRRVMKVIGSINADTGYVVSEIDPEDKDFLSKVRRIPLLFREPEKKGDDKIFLAPIRGEAETELSRLPQLSYHISNRVSGTRDRYILFFVIPRNFDPAKFCEKYRLPDIIMLNIDGRKVGACLKALPYKRICDILKNTDPDTYQKFLRYGKSLLQLPFAFDRIAYSSIRLNLNGEASRGHHQLLKNLGIPVFNHSNLCGDENLIKYVKAEMPD